MRVLLLNPVVSNRSCDDCQRYLYLDQGEKFADKPLVRGGQLVRRMPGQATPCRFCPKIPPGKDPVPENAEELSDKNLLAYRHYLECKATNEFPYDGIVRRNAALIRGAEDLADRVDQQRFGLTVLNTLGRT